MNLWRTIPSLITAASLVALWHACAVFNVLPDYILPAPLDVAKSFLGAPNVYARHTLITAVEAGLGGAIASSAGILCGWALAYSRRVEHLFSPALVASQVFPKEALAPIILLIFGYGIASKVVVSFLLSFFPVCISTLSGIQSTPSILSDYGRSLGLTRFTIFIRINIPHSLPFTASGVKVALTLSVIGAVVGEFIGSQAGLGYLIRNSTSDFATERVYGALVLLGLLGFAFYGFAAVLEGLVLRRFPPSGVAQHE